MDKVAAYQVLDRKGGGGGVQVGEVRAEIAVHPLHIREACVVYLDAQVRVPPPHIPYPVRDEGGEEHARLLSVMVRLVVDAVHALLDLGQRLGQDLRETGTVVGGAQIVPADHQEDEIGLLGEALAVEFGEQRVGRSAVHAAVVHLADLRGVGGVKEDGELRGVGLGIARLPGRTVRDAVAEAGDDDRVQVVARRHTDGRNNRGGHDPHKVYAAYYEAVNNPGGRPTVILAKTIKGYGMGASGEGQNTAHQAKKMDQDSLKKFRTRFDIPVTDEQIESGDLPYYRFPEDSEEMRYLRERRNSLGGYLPQRNPNLEALPIPELSAFDAQLQSSGEREFSTTMAFVRILSTLLKDKQIGKRIVPIVPDESRTFGMEGMFRQYGIWNPKGQQYTPQDKDQLMFYKESVDGQILQEGINEPGAMADWIAAGTSYANSHFAMIPFYIYYSMFGFQRVGDLAWAAGDMHTRGFLIGGTAGRTTLNGEGLQHQDGHSQIQADLIPNCISYDPTFSYEVAVIVHDGLRRMYVEQEDVYYYLTVMNENYTHPAMPQRKGIEEEILKGMYLLKAGEKGDKKVQLMGSGVILNEVIKGAELLKNDFGVDADIWSVPSFNLLHRDAIEVERYNRLHPLEEAKLPFVTRQLQGYEGPVIASTDYIRSFADRIRAYIPNNYHVLGTDGFGRSDSRANLRDFFEVDSRHVAVAALSALAEQGKVGKEVVQQAIEKYGIQTDTAPSWKR